MFLYFVTFGVSAITCKSASNKDVSWFAAWKVPSIKDKIPSHVSGTGFFYTDPTTTLSEATSTVDATTGNPLYYSTLPMYASKPEKYGYMLISDQPAHRTSNPSDSYAHKKGILIFDDDNGIFIEHSVPRFPNDPNITNEYGYPSTGTIYGQSFLCATLTHAQIEQWAQGMLIEKGYVYASNIPSYASKMPSLGKIINKQWDPTLQKVTTIKTSGAEFVLFSKGAKWGQDLYHDFITQHFKTNLYSQTWARGIGTFSSNCTGPYNTYNVLNLNFQGVKWTRMNDHSKWSYVGDYICIGGINRQVKQKERGGGSWCIKDAALAKTMKNVITDYEKC
jgi:deoxyribonuclease-2